VIVVASRLLTLCGLALVGIGGYFILGQQGRAGGTLVILTLAWAASSGGMALSTRDRYRGRTGQRSATTGTT
jgi:hypothetical protein